MKRAVEVNEQNFKHEVLRSSQPVIVDFWATECELCKQLAPLLEEIAVEQAGQVKIVSVNIDQNPRLAAQYHIHSLPTLLYFYNGLVQDHTLGLTDKQTIVTRLQSILGGTVVG